MDWVRSFNTNEPRVIFPAGGGGNAFLHTLEIMNPGCTGISGNYIPETNEYQYMDKVRKIHPIHPESLFVYNKPLDNGSTKLSHSFTVPRYHQLVKDIKENKPPCIVINCFNDRHFIYAMGLMKNYVKRDRFEWHNKLKKDVFKNEKDMAIVDCLCKGRKSNKKLSYYYKHFDKMIVKLSKITDVLEIDYVKYFKDFDRTEMNRISLFLFNERLSDKKYDKIKQFLEDYFEKNTKALLTFLENK